MFIHYLITRFNIKVTNYGPEQMTSPDMNIEWLSARLDLFLKYCAPSVIEQSHKQFTWLIYLHPETPKHILEQLEYLKNTEVNTELRFINDYSEMLENIIQTIKTAPAPFVITSRLDNDDIISKYFIREIQMAFKPQHNTIINFTMGFEYSFMDHVLKKWNIRFKNQFISIFEDSTSMDLKSIYGFAHWKLPVNSTVINITGKPYWIYLRHKLNHSGAAITGIPYFKKPSVLNVFPAIVKEIPLSFSQTMIYTLKWLPKMMKRRLKLKKK